MSLYLRYVSLQSLGLRPIMSHMFTIPFSTYVPSHMVRLVGVVDLVQYSHLWLPRLWLATVMQSSCSQGTLLNSQHHGSLVFVVVVGFTRLLRSPRCRLPQDIYYSAPMQIHCAQGYPILLGFVHKVSVLLKYREGGSLPLL